MEVSANRFEYEIESGSTLKGTCGDNGPCRIRDALKILRC